MLPPAAAVLCSSSVLEYHPTVDGACGVFGFKIAPRAGIALYLTTVWYIHFDELEGRPKPCSGRSGLFILYTACMVESWLWASLALAIGREGE